ncbi:hypothetical protein BVRB_2g034560 [Beta vulgaris subsp. vulgaris]|nr:hypothetical protein BVRB_2g034560 [Beta vulgaris subsp. vulgaris]
MAIIRMKSKYTVKPAEPTWNGILPLSELDQISVITHSSVLYFYDKPTKEEWLNPSNNKIMNTLKESLSHALVPFYPLAGRLSYKGEGRFELECNAMGAELVEVESTMKMVDFGDFYSCTKKLRELLVPMSYYTKPIQDLPVLAVQITRFRCGGLSLGMSMSHVVADGRSAFHFIKEWGRLALGKPLEEAPFLDRRILRAEAHQKTVVDQSERMNYFSQLRLGEDKWGKQVSPTFVVLTKDMIMRLKEVANSISNREIVKDHLRRPYSRFEVVAAHVWRCVCKARELKSEDMSTLMVAVAAHDRMEPPLPSSFFGNAVVDAEISSSVGELISRPLSYACSIVREAIQKVTNEYILASIEFLKKQQNLTKYQYIDDRGIMEGPAYGDHNITVVSWLNLSSHGVDFGWGKEIHMGPPIVQTCDGDIHLSPYKNDGSLIVGVCLQPNEKFVKYITSPIV